MLMFSHAGVTRDCGLCKLGSQRQLARNKSGTLIEFVVRQTTSEIGLHYEIEMFPGATSVYSPGQNLVERIAIRARYDYGISNKPGASMRY